MEPGCAGTGCSIQQGAGGGLPRRDTSTWENAMPGEKLTSASHREAYDLGFDRNNLFFFLEKRHVLNMDVMKKPLKF